ncbi:MAG: PKD domain-containing protein [Thermoanaerobaculia bacterium]|nr:PKD domain-containing protein [Thermoanaerobaculia bacterium]
MIYRLIALCLLLLCGLQPLTAGGVPDVVPGFPNDLNCTPGQLLYRQIDLGRVTNIIYHNGRIYSNNVGAGEPREWLFTDPDNPASLAIVNTTGLPFLTDQGTHGHGKAGDYAGGAGNYRLRRDSPGVNVVESMPVQDRFFDDQSPPLDSGMHRVYYPWAVPFNWLQYGPTPASGRLYRADQLLAEWEPLADHGVAGTAILLGNLLFIVSDASMLGVAAYDIGLTFDTPPGDPVLLDKFTGQVGAYIGSVWENYLVLTGGSDRRLMYVIDYSDPTDLQLVTTMDLSGDPDLDAGTNVPYVQIQDQYVFARRQKIDMESLSPVLELDEVGDHRPPGSIAGALDVSQYTMPIGNLLVSGSYSFGGRDGVGVWCHQASPDRRAPYVGYHVPRPGQTDFPLGAPVSLVIAETLESFTIINGETIILRPVGGDPVDAWTSFSHDGILTVTPKQYLQPDTTYELVVVAGGIRDAADNGIEGYSFTFSTGSDVSGGNGSPTIADIAANPAPAEPSDNVAFSVSATDPDRDSMEYKFSFGDGSPPRDWDASAIASHTYDQPGHYSVKVQVRDLRPDGSHSVVSRTRTVSVVQPVTGPLPRHSSQLALDPSRRVVWAVNPDNDSVARIDADTRVVLQTVDLRELLDTDDTVDPVSVSVDSAGNAWVAARDADLVLILSPGGALLEEIHVGYGAAPQAVVVRNANAFVSVRGRRANDPGNGRLLRFSVSTFSQTGAAELGPFPGAIALSGNGARAYVARFLSREHFGEIWEVDTASMSVTRTIDLLRDRGENGLDSGGSDGPGVPNYVASLVLSPQEDWLWYTAIKTDTNRGLFFRQDTDFNLPMTHDSTVRSALGRIDLSDPNNPHEPNVRSAGSSRARIDIDNSDSPSALVFSPHGDYAFVALQGNDTVAVFDDLAIRAGGGRSSTWRFATDSAPQGLLLDPATERLWIKNFLGRSVTSLDLGEFLAEGDRTIAAETATTVDGERLAANVLAGKTHFYFAGNAVDGQNEMSFEGYISCASCHLDGGHDGRVWDFTQRGEGFRNTTALNGRAGLQHGNVHWTANFDEIQDFVNDIQGEFGGRGFLPDGETANPPLGTPNGGRSQALDDLAIYLASLDEPSIGRSPHRTAGGALTQEARLGQTVFGNLACGSCHASSDFTDSTLGTETLHDVGTLRTSSGQRLGGPLTGIDTPTLLGVFDSAPYLHDGSAETLDEVFEAGGGVVYQLEEGTLEGDTQLPNFPTYNEDSSSHGEMVYLGTPESAVTLTGVDGGTGGSGQLELRYWPRTSGTFRLTVNGAVIEDRPFDAERTNFEWQRLRFFDVPLTAGATNTVRLALIVKNGWQDIGVDDLTVSTSDDLLLASPHRVVLGLSATERSRLIEYLKSLDRVDAGAPSGLLEIFRDGFELGNTTAWSSTVGD